MIQKIHPLEGIGLMRLFGVTNWPDVDGGYYLWEDQGVFVLIDSGEFLDIHMAMRKECRRNSRDMVEAIIEFADKPLRALIEEQYCHVRNLAEIMGFRFVGIKRGRRLDSSETNVIVMERTK